MARSPGANERSNGVVRIAFVGRRRILRPIIARRTVAIRAAPVTIARAIAGRRAIESSAVRSATTGAKLTRASARRWAVGTVAKPRSCRRKRMMFLDEVGQLDEFVAAQRVVLVRVELIK
jgi:hypothetical protein